MGATPQACMDSPWAAATPTCAVVWPNQHRPAVPLGQQTERTRPDEVGLRLAAAGSGRAVVDPGVDCWNGVPVAVHPPTQGVCYWRCRAGGKYI